MLQAARRADRWRDVGRSRHLRRRERPPKPLHHVVEAVELLPDLPDHPEAGVADGVLPNLLGEDDVARLLPGSQEPPLLDPAVELADGASLRPGEVGAAGRVKGRDLPLQDRGRHLEPSHQHTAA